MHRQQKWFRLFLLIITMSSVAWSEGHHPQDFLKSIKGAPDEGVQIAQHFCFSCHAPKPLIDLGAPKIGEKAAWEPRVKRGIKILLAHTEEGFNAMPARGGCFECTDEQLVLALLALLPEELRKDFINELKVH